MSLMYYDIAMTKRIKNLYPETYFAAPEEIFSINAKNHGGTKIVMPMIGVYRLPDFSINSSFHNEPQARFGVPVLTGNHKNPEFPNKPVASHLVPVSLQYQIDVYSVKREICDGLTAELILEFIEEPWLDVNLKSLGDDYVQKFSIKIDDSVSDNTSLTEFDETGRFYRLTITLNIEQAYLMRVDKDLIIDTVEVDYDAMNDE